MAEKDDKKMLYEKPNLARLDEGTQGQIDCFDGSVAIPDCLPGQTAAGLCEAGTVAGNP